MRLLVYTRVLTKGSSKPKAPSQNNLFSKKLPRFS
uniref:Uncharacterized protein n=1 Tax=Anguilla anguilla TaxID=7936 RepID=A0A0E9VNL9_ANGAN